MGRLLLLTHRYLGIAVGLLMAMWCVSGLVMMYVSYPSLSESEERCRIGPRGAGPPTLTGAQLLQALQSLAQRRADNIVSIVGAPLEGHLYLIASDRQDRQWRLDAQGRAAPLNAAQRRFIAGVLGGPLTLITQGDDYYFSHHGDPVRLPALRLVSASGDRYYVDPVSGALLAKLDAAARGYRWWHDALHRLDFAAIVRGRLQWDVLMWLLMSGATALSLTGVYLAGRRVLR